MKIIAVTLILICPLILSFVFYHLSVDPYREEEKERKIEREIEREVERLDKFYKEIEDRSLQLSPEWTDLQTDINSVIYL